jgi:hypothetical protein
MIRCAACRSSSCAFRNISEKRNDPNIQFFHEHSVRPVRPVVHPRKSGSEFRGSASIVLAFAGFAAEKI